VSGSKLRSEDTLRRAQHIKGEVSCSDLETFYLVRRWKNQGGRRWQKKEKSVSRLLGWGEVVLIPESFKMYDGHKLGKLAKQ